MFLKFRIVMGAFLLGMALLVMFAVAVLYSVFGGSSKCSHKPPSC